ncbi:PEP-CTERM/exosortase system-associated acyltransferase [Thalassotalea euphylliae]|uniref:PEP-CTERM/exosortase system-associated acyltransferase n=1 Tax=Thalassotalea euphylliae TaxID=1655234 RepID=A0A3E0TVR0_9GAMM|nr:PEP-CTERM/exosortase system-associated acyltransferase [Thalassotalea euphylliae]REL28559.1 PEP-CTERM/exosortase system-associated acyltransferase [Thalassotalea euphylliae]
MAGYSLAENFAQHFQIKFANTKALRQEAFKIRYGVYAAELGWEPENERHMETDECDDYAFHCLLEHKRTGVYAGCVRLVIPPSNQPELKLPFEAHCLESARKDVIDSTQLPRGSFGEISRLAVLSSFRRRENEKNVPFVLKSINPATVYTEEERRNFPNIAMGLYIAAVALADICNHRGAFVMMEPRLNRRLTRFGLPFVQCGEEMDYHGIRAMFHLERSGFCSHLSPELAELYQKIFNDLSNQMFLVPFANPLDK